MWGLGECGKDVAQRRPLMGSADPHGVGDIDAAAQRLGWATCAATRWGAANEDELVRRAMPVVNVQPQTQLPAAHSGPAGPPPPVVRSVAEVVPCHTLRAVRVWRRQLRRCMRAARAGRLHAAKQLRPADLWLHHESNSVATTAQWNWDLRPLERGEPAVAMLPQPPTVRCQQTGVNIDEWLQAGAGAPDAAIVHEVAIGVSDDSQCVRGSLLCAPHTGALAALAQAETKLSAGVAAGWCTASDELPCWPLRSSPYSIVDESVRAGKPKFRLTTDLSWPVVPWQHASGDVVDSVNAAGDRSAWPLNPLVRVSEFAEAVAILAGPPSARRGTSMWSLDCEAFYRLVGRRQHEIWRNAAFAPDGSVVLDQRCCFGDAAAATKCARISNVLACHVRAALAEVDRDYPTVDAEWVAWQQQRRACGVSAELFWFGIYVDDGMCGSADDLVCDAEGRPVCCDGAQVRRSQLHFEAARETVRRFGWQSAPSKETLPTDVVEVLGMCVNLREWRMYLGAAKAPRYAAAARTVAAMAWCPAKVFAELLGRLQFAAQCWPDGCEVLRPCWRAARVVTRTAVQAVPVTVAVARALAAFAEHLDQDEDYGVPLACRTPPTKGANNEACVIYADASGTVGYSAWTVRADDLLIVCGEWSEDEKRLNIATLELLAATWGPVALTTGDVGSELVSFTDNVIVAKELRVGWSDDSLRNAVLTRRSEWLRAAGQREAVARVTSKNNVWADWGSRGQLPKVVAAARAAGLRVVHVPVPDIWRSLPATAAQQPAPDGGRSASGGAGSRERRGAARGQAPLSRRGKCRQTGRGSLDRGAVVDYLPRLGVRSDPSARPSADDRRLAVRVSDRGQPRGLRGLAGGVPTVRTTGVRKVDQQVRVVSSCVVPSTVPCGARTRSRRGARTGHTERVRAIGDAAAEARARRVHTTGPSARHEPGVGRPVLARCDVASAA